MPLAMRASTDAAGDHNHGIDRIRTAGDVGGNVRVGLLLNFARSLAQQLADKIAAAAKREFFGHHAQRAVRRDEVHGLDTLVTLDGKQKVLEKQRTAGAGSGDSQVLRMVSNVTPVARSFGTES